MNRLAKLFTVVLLASTLVACAAWKAPCVPMAKAACQLAGLIPTVGETASALCESFANSMWVQNLCKQEVQPRVVTFLSGIEEWLKSHGLSAFVELKPTGALMLMKKKAMFAPVGGTVAPPVVAPIKGPAKATPAPAKPGSK